ncbi:MAG: hypothetical protein ACTHL5_08640 [Rhodanobacter sp.]
MAQVEIERTEIVELNRPSMNWGAIIAGWLVAVGVAFLMYVGGLAMGFSVFDPHDAEATARGIGIGTALWMVVTWIVALLLGGMFASWFDSRDDRNMGVMHGIAVWGLSVAASALLLALGMGGAIGSGARLGAHARMAHGQQAGIDARVLLQAQLMQRLRQAGGAASGSIYAPATGAMATAPARLDPRTANAATMALIANRPDTAKALLTANTNLSPADIDSSVQDLAAPAARARSDIKAAADSAAHYMAMAMWVLFASLLLSLIAAAIGGSLGAGHVHRVYHDRRYARGTPLH